MEDTCKHMHACTRALNKGDTVLISVVVLYFYDAAEQGQGCSNRHLGDVRACVRASKLTYAYTHTQGMDSEHLYDVCACKQTHIHIHAHTGDGP
jgi:hypothetical protein